MTEPTLLVWEINGHHEYEAVFPTFHQAWRVANLLNRMSGPGFLWIQPGGVRECVRWMREDVDGLKVGHEDAAKIHMGIQARLTPPNDADLWDHERDYIARVVKDLVHKIIA